MEEAYARPGALNGAVANELMRCDGNLPLAQGDGFRLNVGSS